MYKDHQWYPATIKDPATFPSPHGPVGAHQLLVEYDDTLGTGRRIGPHDPIRPLAPPPYTPNGPVGAHLLPAESVNWTQLHDTLGTGRRVGLRNRRPHNKGSGNAI